MPTHATALIVEDEPLARAKLRQLLPQTPWIRCVGEAATGRAAVASIDEVQPDLVFLDVQLPGMTGLDVLGRIRHRPAVIFTTAHDRFAVAAFELGALDYLLKPFSRDRFIRAMERARPHLEAAPDESPVIERARTVLGTGVLTRLFARDGARLFPVPTGLIEQVEACDDFVLLHVAGKAYRVNVQLAELAAKLDPRSFVRVHRSHLVNLAHVQSFEPYDGSRFRLTLKSGATLLSSRQRSKVLRELGR
jgi:two-component system LytT family response regulator